MFLPSETACFEFQVADCCYLSSAEEFVACKIRSSQDGPLCVSCVTQSVFILFIPLPFIYASSCFSSPSLYTWMQSVSVKVALLLKYTSGVYLLLSYP